MDLRRGRVLLTLLSAVAIAERFYRTVRRFNATGDTNQTKTLLRILIADLPVNSRREIVPTYRVGAPVVCAQTSSMARLGIEPRTLRFSVVCSTN